MYLLYARVTFNTTNRRNQAITRAQTEAANRGLTPATYTWDGETWTGAAPSGTHDLLLAFAGPFQAVDDTHNALQVYLDANGRVDGVAGTMWLSDA